MQMKLFFRLTLCLLFLPMYLQAQDADLIQKLDSVAKSLYDQENYKKCAEVLEKQKELILKKSGEKDSLYFSALVLQSSSCFLSEEYDKAVDLAKEALDIWAKKYDLNDPNYILMLNNYGAYVGNGKNPNHELGLQYGLKALDMYEKLMVRDENLTFILEHIAAELSQLNRSSEAVKYELRAISILKEVDGEHSEEYLSGLESLSSYYRESGQEDKAKETDDLYAKLSEEKENGIVDLPEFIEFKTVEECRAHTQDAYIYIDYYLNHMLNADKMGQAAGYIMGWSMVTDQVKIMIGMNEAKLSSDKKTLPYFVAYMAGCSKYAILADSAQFNRDMYVYSMAHVLDFYNGNKAFTGKVNYLEKFANVFDKKGEGALEAMLTKEYEKLMQEMDKANRVNLKDVVKEQAKTVK